MSTEKNDSLHPTPAAIDDESLDQVVGGGYFHEHIVDSREDVRFIFQPGDIVYVDSGLYFFTQRCRIVRCEIYDFSSINRFGYSDCYVVESMDYNKGDFNYIYTRVGRQDIKSADF